MMRDIPPVAVEGADPWAKVQIDPATRQLAESAAAAAGLAVEEWLERAIRRACPNAFRGASVSAPTSAATAPQTPTAARRTQSPEIETSLAALLARVQQRQAQAEQSAQRHTEPPLGARIDPQPAAAVVPEPPPVPQRSPTIAERLARQHVDEIEDSAKRRQPGATAEKLREGQAWDEESDAAPWMFPTGDAEPGGGDLEPRKPFKLWAAQDDEDRAEDPEAAHVAPLLSRRGIKHLTLLAIGVALAAAAGAVTAQYLVPERSQAPHLSNAQSGGIASVARILAPAPDMQPSADGSNTASSVPLPGIASLPAEPSAMLPSADTASSDLAAPSDLPPVSGLPSPPPFGDGAPSALVALPLVPTPPATSLSAAPLPPLPMPSIANDTTPAASGAVSAPIVAQPDLSAPPKPAATTAKHKPAAPTATVIAPTPSAAAADAPAAPTLAGGTAPHVLNSDAGSAAPTDAKALIPWLEQRVKAGDAIAQYRLGVLYALGQGVQQDYQRAAQLFETAAVGGVAEAQYNIGVMYSEGLGIGRNSYLAAQWYGKAAAQGNANAAFNLGVAYVNGVGVQQSVDQAARWFRRAAVADVVNAQFNLALLYERGDGVPVSQVEAYAWYSAAAARGDAGAAQRRDQLVNALSPSILKAAQARAQQVAAIIESNGNSSSNDGPSTDAAASKP